MSDILAEAQAHIQRREGLIAALREEEAQIVDRLAQVRAAIVALDVIESGAAGYSREIGIARSEEAALGPRPTRRDHRGHRRASLGMVETVLAAIRQQGPIAGRELARAMGLGQSTISRATRELLRKGQIRATVVRSKGAPLAYEAAPFRSSSTASVSATRTAPAMAAASTGGRP
jgi:DNA-binding transcriptional ArsR family regulator